MKHNCLIMIHFKWSQRTSDFLIASFSVVFPRRYLKRARHSNRQQEANTVALILKVEYVSKEKYSCLNLISAIASLLRDVFSWEVLWYLDSYNSLKNINMLMFSLSLFFFFNALTLVLPLKWKSYWPVDRVKWTTRGQAWSFQKTLTPHLFLPEVTTSSSWAS